MAKSKYLWSGHNEFYRRDSRGRVKVLKRDPTPKEFAKAVIEQGGHKWIAKPVKEKKAKAKAKK